MVLTGLHGSWRGTGGKYDTFIDNAKRIPGAEKLGDAYINFMAPRPKVEGFVVGYGAADVLLNSGDATVDGLHDVLKDAEFGFVNELTDPFGNGFDLAGGMIEEGGERINYKGIEMIGSGIEGFGEFISDPIESTFGDGAGPEGYDLVVANGYDPKYFFADAEHLQNHGAAEGVDPGTANNSTGGGGNPTEPTPTPTPEHTTEPTPTPEPTTEPTASPTAEPTTAAPVNYETVQQNLDDQDLEALWEYFNDASATSDVSPDTVYLDDPEGGYDINVENYGGFRELHTLDESESEYLQDNLGEIVELWQEDSDRF